MKRRGRKPGQADERLMWGVWHARLHLPSKTKCSDPLRLPPVRNLQACKGTSYRVYPPATVNTEQEETEILFTWYRALTVFFQGGELWYRNSQPARIYFVPYVDYLQLHYGHVGVRIGNCLQKAGCFQHVFESSASFRYPPQVRTDSTSRGLPMTMPLRLQKMSEWVGMVL